MVHQLITWLKHIATAGPLELFVFIGSILEELIAPIPSPLVMSLAGFLAHERGGQWWYYILLAVIGSVGKTCASVLLYVIGDKAEDVVVSRWGKLLGLSREKLDRASQLISHGWWDEVILVFLRAVPLIPTFVVSIGCGVLKTPMPAFLWTTFFGSFLRNLMMIWLGVAGTQYVQKFWENGGSEMAQRPLFISSAGIGLLIGVGIALLIKRRLRAAKTPEHS